MMIWKLSTMIRRGPRHGRFSRNKQLVLKDEGHNFSKLVPFHAGASASGAAACATANAWPT
jgi:hypothetical protein